MAESRAGEPVATIKADERITIIIAQVFLICIFQNVGTHLFAYIIFLYISNMARYDVYYL